MKLVNRTDYSEKLIRAVIRFVRPPGIKRFNVTLRKKKGYIFRGHGGPKNVLVKINPDTKYPCDLYLYQRGQLKARYSKPDPVAGVAHRKKGRRYWLANKTETLIYVLAHELMHVRQGQKGAMRGRVWGARGKFSEIETESWAIRKLREYRQSA